MAIALQHQITPNEDSTLECRNVGSCRQFHRAIQLNITRIASETNGLNQDFLEARMHVIQYLFFK